MTTYNVLVSYTFEDSIYVEAEDMQDALDKGYMEMKDKYSVLSENGGYTLPWDDVSAYEAYEEEE